MGKPIRYSTCFTISKRYRIRGILTRRKYTNLSCLGAADLCAVRGLGIRRRLITMRQETALFCDDPLGDMLTYLCEPRPWANKIVAIAHNAKAFDPHFILNRAILRK